MCFDMVELSDLTPKQRSHVMDSDRYSIRDARVHDDVAGRFVAADEIVENMGEMW